ncbi:MAG TPA: hypothetical protein VFP09_07875 [Desertimonas sp.]|nr:hypothetical protein [Desertimonas sp.]
MLCPYGNEVGDPARRADCALKATTENLGQCHCDLEMALLDGRPTHGEAGELLIDPQTWAVQEWWIDAETAARETAASVLRSGRPTL